jgi:lipoate-protein ligase A
MQRLDLSLPTCEENLALDEALLEAAEAGELADEVLRLWEMPQVVVVVGRSSVVAQEVHLEACRADRVPIRRRVSGGAAIVAGPGCLMYSAVLRYAGRDCLPAIDHVHAQVLAIVQRCLGRLVPGIQHQGISDLALGDRKCSGNSVRCKRDFLLYHGTLLYAFDPLLLDRYLATAPRQPAYRAGRTHSEFVINLPAEPAQLREALARGFGARKPLDRWPSERTAQLLRERYAQESWHFAR